MEQHFFSAAHLVLVAAAILGTFIHWVKEKYAGETAGSPIEYLIAYPWNSLGMFGATLSACAALITTGALVGLSLPVIFWLGFATGYTADSALNKGPKQ